MNKEIVGSPVETIDESVVIASLEAGLVPAAEIDPAESPQLPLDNWFGNHANKVLRASEAGVGLALGTMAIMASRSLGLESGIMQTVTGVAVAAPSSQVIRFLAPSVSGYIAHEHRAGPLERMQNRVMSRVDDSSGKIDNRGRV